MKQTLRYDQLSCRLVVQGLPDVSAGQAGDAVGIITGWTLQWSGRPELEGRKDHLLALLQVVLPYARDLISGVARTCGEPPLPVRLSPRPEGGHLLQLHSSQPDTPPLDLPLDDAELSDLVRLLDQFRLDSRLQLPLDLPVPQPLRPRELQERVPLRQRLAAPLGGALALLLVGGASLLLPEPKPRPQAATAAPTATPAAAPSAPPAQP